MSSGNAAAAKATPEDGGSPVQRRQSTNSSSDVKNQKKKPRKGAAFDHYDRQVVDYVRTATAKNVWYYRCGVVVVVERTLSLSLPLCVYLSVEFHCWCCCAEID